MAVWDNFHFCFSWTKNEWIFGYKFGWKIRMAVGVQFSNTAWRVFKNRVFSGPYIPALGLNTEILQSQSPNSVQIQGNTDQKKLLIWILFTQWKFCIFLWKNRWLFEYKSKILYFAVNNEWPFGYTHSYINPSLNKINNHTRIMRKKRFCSSCNIYIWDRWKWTFFLFHHLQYVFTNTIPLMQWEIKLQTKIIY